MLRSKSFRRLVLVAAVLLIPAVAVAAEESPTPAAPGAPVVAPDAVMTPAFPEPVPEPLFLTETYWCSFTVEDCGRTWHCGKTCPVGQSCDCAFLYGQTPEGGCIIRNYGAFCY
jgi:hypothetical protein